MANNIQAAKSSPEFFDLAVPIMFSETVMVIVTIPAAKVMNCFTTSAALVHH